MRFPCSFFPASSSLPCWPALERRKRPCIIDSILERGYWRAARYGQLKKAKEKREPSQYDEDDVYSATIDMAPLAVSYTEYIQDGQAGSIRPTRPFLFGQIELTSV